MVRLAAVVNLINSSYYVSGQSKTVAEGLRSVLNRFDYILSKYAESWHFRIVVVLTLTRIIKPVAAGHTTVTLAWKNIPGKTSNKSK